MFDLSKGGHHGADPKNHAWNFSSIISNKFLHRYLVSTKNYLKMLISVLNTKYKI
jgi:hypothetical protein